jgi:hypothetical protein
VPEANQSRFNAEKACSSEVEIARQIRHVRKVPTGDEKPTIEAAGTTIPARRQAAARAIAQTPGKKWQLSSYGRNS